MPSMWMKGLYSMNAYRALISAVTPLGSIFQWAQCAGVPHPTPASLMLCVKAPLPPALTTQSTQTTQPSAEPGATPASWMPCVTASTPPAQQPSQPGQQHHLQEREQLLPAGCSV